MCMPLKIAGKAIMTIVESIDAISMPNVVFESATHLYWTIKSQIYGVLGLTKKEDYKKIAWEPKGSTSSLLCFWFFFGTFEVFVFDTA